jgi:hypothetical protein
MMNRFKKTLGFTIFLLMVAPVEAMYSGGPFGKTQFREGKKVVKSEEAVIFEADLADRQNILHSSDAETSESAAALIDSPETKADKILNEFYRRTELGVSEDEEEAPEVPADEEVALVPLVPVHPLEDSSKIAPEGDRVELAPIALPKRDEESLAGADDAASNSDEDVQEVSGEVGEEFSEEEVAEKKIEEEVVSASVAASPFAKATEEQTSPRLRLPGRNATEDGIEVIPDVQVPEVPELNPAPAQKIPALDVPKVDGANHGASAPKNEQPVKPAQSEKFYTPAVDAVKKVPGYFAVNYLKKGKARDMSLENLNQHKLNLLITFVLYAATASAIGSAVYGIANWFKKTEKPVKPEVVPVKRPMAVAPKA